MESKEPTDPTDPTESIRLTPSMEDYLRHIYRLEREAGGEVPNSMLAERLDVSQPTVTSMFEALSERGLIDRKKYRPVRLTDEGRTVALGIIRKHRLAETMLLNLFGYGLSEVDAEADVLEHHLSDRLCREIERVLGMPETDPHGDPIPDVNLDVTHDGDAGSLAEVAESAHVEVTRILTQDDDVLEYLVSCGLEPGVALTVVGKTTFGLTTLVVSDSRDEVRLPKTVTAKILVRPVGAN